VLKCVAIRTGYSKLSELILSARFYEGGLTLLYLRFVMFWVPVLLCFDDVPEV